MCEHGAELTAIPDLELTQIHNRNTGRSTAQRTLARCPRIVHAVRGDIKHK